MKPSAEIKRLKDQLDKAKSLIDGAYVIIELYKPEDTFNKKWRIDWMTKAKELIPDVDSLWY